MKITIRKIAEMAGVSRGTVDRAINGRPGVKPEIRENILRIINEQDYIPNIAAKALAYNKNPIIIGVVMPSRELAFFDEIQKGIGAAVRETHNMGIKVEMRYVENQPAGALLVMDELLELGVSGIMISAMDHPEIRAKINEAADRKIPVITFNSDVTNCRRLCFVGQDLYKSGAVAAGLMARVASKGSAIIALTGNMAFQAHRDRVNGFADALNKTHGNYIVAEVIQGFDRYNETYDGVKKAIDRYDNINGIYMATGHINACLDAVTEKGLAGKIHIICNDTLPEVIENMKKGIIDFTIVQDPFSQGYKPLRMLREYIFSGKKPEQEYILTEIGIKIPENL